MIASDATILGLTIMKTMTISVDARKFGFRTPISNLLLRDGIFSSFSLNFSPNGIVF